MATVERASEQARGGGTHWWDPPPGDLVQGETT